MSHQYYVRKILELLQTIEAMPQEEVDRIANGCGPQKKFLGIDFVPDDLAGINITPACDLHDVGYNLGDNDEDKTVSDLMFLNLMVLHIIYSKAGDVQKAAALNLAMKFFWAVYFHGKDAFYADK
jgi:hypothetical protein